MIESNVLTKFQEEAASPPLPGNEEGKCMLLFFFCLLRLISSKC